MASPRLKIDFARMFGDRRIGFEYHAFRRLMDALIGGLGCMAHGARNPEEHMFSALRRWLAMQGSAAWHMAQRPSTVSRTAGKCDEATKASFAADAAGSPVSTFGTVESHMMMMKRMAAASHVQVGLPLRACIVLK